jgi:hypothetical protein
MKERRGILTSLENEMPAIPMHTGKGRSFIYLIHRECYSMPMRIVPFSRSWVDSALRIRETSLVEEIGSEMSMPHVGVQSQTRGIVPIWDSDIFAR